MMKEEIKLRQGTIDDIESIVNLWMKSAQFHAEIEPRFQYSQDISQPTKEYYSKQLQSEEAYIAIAQTNDNLVGFICAIVHERPPIHKHRKMGFIEGLFIEPDSRRNGLGTNLWHMALDWLKLQEVSKIQLTVAVMNTEAIEFWKKLGFSELMLRFELD